MKFSPGAALTRTATIWLRGFVPFTVFAFLVRLPAVLWERVQRRAEFAELLLGPGLELVVAAGLTFGVFERLQGRRAGLLRVLRTGLARLLPVAGVLFIAMLLFGSVGVALAATGNGVLALLVLAVLAVPLFHFAANTIVAIPVAVVERPDTFGAFSRAAELTHGQRLLVFVVMLAVWGGCAATRVWLFHFPWDVGREQAFWIGAVVRAVLAVPPAVAVAVVYHDLRGEIPPEQLAAIFD
jgi:hypothetical protein